MLPSLQNEIERTFGMDIIRDGIPLGITRFPDNKFLYYKGSDPPAKYLSEIDTLIGESFNIPFAERKENVEYFYTLPFDTGTKAGFIPMGIFDENGDELRSYFTQHQPTIYSTSKDKMLKRIWFRKIEITLENGVMDRCWEKFERD